MSRQGKLDAFVAGEILRRRWDAEAIEVGRRAAHQVSQGHEFARDEARVLEAIGSADREVEAFFDDVDAPVVELKV